MATVTVNLVLGLIIIVTANTVLAIYTLVWSMILAQCHEFQTVYELLLYDFVKYLTALPPGNFFYK